MRIFAGKLLTPRGWLRDCAVEIKGGMILSVSPAREGDAFDKKANVLVPGLVDTHCHGGETYYTRVPDEALLGRYLARLAHCGVTDVLLTCSTFSGKAAYAASLSFIRDAMERQAKGMLPGARIRGVHLEGPFLNPEKCGAMDVSAMLAPSPEAFEDFFGTYKDIIRLVTVAPEREGADKLIAHLLSSGIRVQAGHTNATFEQAQATFDSGVISLCHTFNATRSIHHREPGVVTAALLDERVYCEAICDFRHLHPATVEMIYRLKGPRRMAVVSDSVQVTGLPDGEYDINGEKYLIVDGTQRVNGGATLSGGACYLDGAVRDLLSIGIPDGDVYTMVSATPAERSGIADAGRIEAGRPAHIAAFDDKGTPVFTLIGNDIYE